MITGENNLTEGRNQAPPPTQLTVGQASEWKSRPSKSGESDSPFREREGARDHPRRATASARRQNKHKTQESGGREPRARAASFGETGRNTEATPKHVKRHPGSVTTQES